MPTNAEIGIGFNVTTNTTNGRPTSEPAETSLRKDEGLQRGIRILLRFTEVRRVAGLAEPTRPVRHLARGSPKPQLVVHAGLLDPRTTSTGSRQ